MFAGRLSLGAMPRGARASRATRLPRARVADDSGGGVALGLRGEVRGVPAAAERVAHAEHVCVPRARGRDVAHAQRHRGERLGVGAAGGSGRGDERVAVAVWPDDR